MEYFEIETNSILNSKTTWLRDGHLGMAIFFPGRRARVLPETCDPLTSRNATLIIVNAARGITMDLSGKRYFIFFALLIARFLVYSWLPQNAAFDLLGSCAPVVQDRAAPLFLVCSILADIDTAWAPNFLGGCQEYFGSVKTIWC